MQDKEGGYMSVRKVAALKRVKSLTRDVNIVNEAIQMSNKLELSADTLKVRYCFIYWVCIYVTNLHNKYFFLGVTRIVLIQLIN